MVSLDRLYNVRCDGMLKTLQYLKTATVPVGVTV
jgi:hypothetical protein